MKVLFTLPYIPIPPNFGGALRVYNIIRMVAQHHEVSIFSFGERSDIQKLRNEFGSNIKNVYLIPRHWPRKFRRFSQFYSLFTKHSFFYMLAHSKVAEKMLAEILRENEFDIIQTEFAHMASYNLDSHAIRILDAHNVEYDNFRRIWHNAHSPLRKLHYYGEYKKFFHEEIEACRRYDALFVTSPRDKDIFEKDISDMPKYVIPNGVDSKYFIPSEQTVEQFSLVFTGAMSYVPNYDGILNFLDTTFPLIQKELPQIKLYIIGSRPPKQLIQRRSNNLIVSGYVDDVRPFVWRSNIYIVPLRMGSGTRLKVLEAMAMKKPIVTTSIGCEGILVEHEKSVLIADQPEAFAQSVIQLINDARLRNRLINNSYELMKQHYEWSAIGAQMEEVYQQLYKSHQTLKHPSNKMVKA